MADNSKIEWTDATWNPVTGCEIKSPGCANCYAMKLAGTRLRNHPSRSGLTRDTKAGPVWTGEVRFNEQWLDQPLRWKRPRMIFVCAHGDLFAPGVTDAMIDKVFAVMSLCPQHQFQVLTKRPDRMLEYIAMESADTDRRAEIASDALALNSTTEHHGETRFCTEDCLIQPDRWPLSNVWLGCSVEDQARANERRESMRRLAEMGWLTWVSYEPALGPVDWTGWEFLRWMVSGGESDSDGKSARWTHPQWHRDTRDWCAPNGIAYNFKQWGAWVTEDQSPEDILLPGEAHLPWSEHVGDQTAVYRVGKKAAGRLLDGRTHDAFPEVSR